MNIIDELIKKHCPNGVKYKKLGDLVHIEKGKQLNKTKLLVKGLYPVINGGIMPSGYWNEYNYNENLITISQGGASAGYVNFINTKFWAGAHCYVVSKVNDNVLYRFVYHFLKSKEIEMQNSQVGAGIPSISLGYINSLNIPIPPVEVQKEIINLLDKFLLLLTELSEDLIARQKQYEHYSKLIFDKYKDNRVVKLGDICEIYDGTHQTPKYTNSGVKFISVESIDNIYNSKKYISKEDYDKYKIKPKINDIFMTRITAGIIGKCAIYDKEEDLAYYVSLALIRPNEKIVRSKYIKYYIESYYGKKELNKYILHNANPPKINKDAIGKIKIILPSIEEQDNVINILDKLYELCNSTEKGLPAEIEARQKQYEYYRDKLLTFKEFGNE